MRTRARIRKNKRTNGLTCSHCKHAPRPGQRYCLKHHAEYARTAYQTNPEKRRRDLARRSARQARKMGRLVAGPCEVCGSGDVVMHHDDYAKPLAVRWFCRAHHVQHHREAAE